MRLVNLTPHTIHWYTQSKTIVPIEPSQPTLRLIEEEKNETVLFNAVHDLQIVEVDYLVDLSKLPSENPNSVPTLYIVSYMIARACDWRRDFVYPYDMVRDTENRVIGCRKFGRVYVENPIPSYSARH